MLADVILISAGPRDLSKYMIRINQKHRKNSSYFNNCIKREVLKFYYLKLKINQLYQYLDNHNDYSYAIISVG
jgi:hypothetical protein